MVNNEKVSLVAERSKELRRRLSISQRDWGVLFGKSESTVILNEKGTSKLDAEDFLNIQSFFGDQALLYLFEIKDHPFIDVPDWEKARETARAKIKELKEKAKV